MTEPLANPPPPPDELTIPHRLVAAARRWPERTFLHWEGGSLTFADLERHVRRRAAELYRRGLRPGGRAALDAPNRPETLRDWFAVNWLGGTAVLLNPSLTAPERQGLLAHARPDLVLDESSEPGDGPSPEPPLARPDDPAMVIYTSGTTSRPKGVLQSHLTYALTGEAFPRWLGLSPEDRLMCLLPLFHINAQAYSVMGALCHGLPLVLLPGFSLSRFWEWVLAFEPTQVNLIGSMLMLLLKSEAPPSSHPLRLIYNALALDETHHRQVEETFGVRLVAGYGLSECPFGTIVPPGVWRPGSMGRPRDLAAWGLGNQLEVVDEMGRALPPGETGEIRLRNAAVFLGYLGDPERTAERLRDGWLYTGDRARRDEEGYLYFAGRDEEVIRRRGENIAAAEVEEALLAHPEVREAAVVGVPSPLTEEDVKAFVALVPGSRLRGPELFAWCGERLAPHKVPRFLEVLPELPKTPTMRVAKNRLRGEDRPRGELFDRESLG